MVLAGAVPAEEEPVAGGNIMSKNLTSPELFTSQACQALPEQIESIILFGSAAAGDYLPGTSDFDLLLILRHVTTAELNALSPLIQRWYREGNPLPLIFTGEQLALSVDTFAAEFLEMKQSRRILYGTDPIAEMTINLEHVRIHLERELKGKLLALRNRYALAVGRRRQIAQLMSDSFSTFMSLFRVALRLFQPDAPAEKMDALRLLATHFPIDLKPFVTIDEVRRRRRTWASVEINTLFNQYCQAIETIVDAIDRHLLHSDQSQRKSHVD